MKKLLIIVNTILIFLLGISVLGAFFGGSGEKLEGGKKKTARKSQDAPAPAAAPQKFKVPSSDEAVSIIVNKNVFDTQRTGGVTGRGGAVAYTLVGFYRVGSSQGAIITSKGNTHLGTRG